MELFKTINMGTARGRFVQFYGPTASGKTTSVLASAPEPINYLAGEFRDIQPALDAIEQTEGRQVVLYDAPKYFDDPRNMREYLVGELSKDELGYNSLIFDGSSQFMNGSVGELLETEYYDTREQDKIKRKLAEETARDPKIYGSLASEMIRIFNLLSKFSGQKGIMVVVIALSKSIQSTKKVLEMTGVSKKLDNPKFWDIMRIMNVENASDIGQYNLPNYDGNKFLELYPGLMDYIGYVERRYENGKLVFPPRVSFESDEHLGKWTGKRPTRGRPVGTLDLRKIFKQKGGEK